MVDNKNSGKILKGLCWIDAKMITTNATMYWRCFTLVKLKVQVVGNFMNVKENFSSVCMAVQKGGSTIEQAFYFYQSL